MNRRWALWFAGIFVVGLLALMPLRLAVAGIADQGFSARQVAGTIWYGRIGELMFRSRRLGTFEVAVEPVPLLVGTVRAHFNRMDDPDGQLEGLLLRGGSSGVRGLDGRIAIAGLLGDLPVELFEAVDLTLVMSGGRCVAASGQARVTLAAPLPGIGATQLRGTLRCEGQRVRFRLADPSGQAALEFYLQGDGRYRAWLRIAGAPPETLADLALAGFRPTAEGLTMSAQGQW